MTSGVLARRLNHAVLFVRDARRSAEFYMTVLGFEEVMADDSAVFLRAAGSENHHDLGLFTVGVDAPSPLPGGVGLYHLAWQVHSIRDLAAAIGVLRSLDAYVDESDHGATKSVYGRDPDGHELEITWMVPREHWGELEHSAVVQRLDLESEIARWG